MARPGSQDADLEVTCCQQLQGTPPDPGHAQCFKKDPFLSLGMPLQLGDFLNAISFVSDEISAKMVLRRSIAAEMGE